MRRLASLALLAAWGCGQPDRSVEYEPYAGPTAYPSKRPRLPTPEGYFGYVSDRGSDTVTVVDLPVGKVVARVPIGRDPVSIDAPRYVSVDARGDLYTVLSYPPPTPLPGPHAKHTTTVRYGFLQKLAADDLHVLAELQIDPSPGELVLAPDGSTLVVTHFELSRALDTKLSAEEQKSKLDVIDPMAMTARSTKICRAPHGAAFGADGRTVVVTCYADDTLALVDTANLSAPPAALEAGCKGPLFASAHRATQLVAIGCAESRETRLLDLGARLVSDKSFVTEGAPQAAAWSADGDKLWLPTQTPDALLLFEVSTRRVLLQRVFDAATCLRPHGATLARDSASLYLVCEGDHVGPGHVLALDPNTLATKTSIEAGVFPDRLTYRSTP